MPRSFLPSRVLYAMGLGGLGVLSLIFGDFALQWQPVPKSVPWRMLLADISGAILVAGAVGLLFPRTIRRAAAALAIFILLWVVVLQGPLVVEKPGNVGVWLGFFEDLAIASGCWILAVSVGMAGLMPRGALRGARNARFLFALSLLLFGVAHLVYPAFTAAMIPAWLPEREALAYFTGGAHIAAGLGLLFNVVPRLAATLETIMMASFVALVHVPRVLAQPDSRLEWTLLCVALALTGAAWATTTSLRDVPRARSNRG
jgi:uncharacterized membrane protein